MHGTPSRATLTTIVARAALVAVVFVVGLVTSASPADAAPCSYGTPSGDYCYVDLGGAASIVGYTGADTILTIPSTLDGLPVTTIGMYAFMSCSLTSVTLPDSVTTIGEGAFSSCVLNSVNLGNGVTTIGEFAFTHNFLASVDLPASVTTLGNIAFDFNPLTAVRMAGNAPSSIGLDVFGDPEHGTDPLVTFHSGATYSSGAPYAPGTWIANSTFYRVQEESTVTFSSVHGSAPAAVDVVTLNELAGISDGQVADPGDPSESGWQFDGWYDAPTGGVLVTFPMAVTADATLYAHWTAHPCDVGTPSGDFCYTEAGGNATIVGYLGAGGELVIPGTLDGHPVTAVADNVFASAGLTSVNLPESLISIGDSAFQNNSLAELTVRDSVTSIGADAFVNNAITSLWLGDSVESIGMWAFANNPMTHVTIPASVTEIGTMAFRVDALDSVSMKGDAPPTLGDDAFGVVGGGYDPLVTFHAGASYTSVAPGYWRAGSTDYRVQEESSITWVTDHGTAPHQGSLITLNALDDRWDGTVWNPGALTADGYRFTGWYDAASGGDLVEFPLAITSDTTLYAHWATPAVTAPATADPGLAITVDGTGFEPGESVTIELHSDPVLLATVVADGAGAVHATVTLPAGAAAGAHTLVFTGAASGVTSKPIVLSGDLPFTGTSPVAPSLVALSLIALGLVLRTRVP